MYDNKSQRRSSHVYEQVLLLLLCYGLSVFCENRQIIRFFGKQNIRTVRIRYAQEGIIELRTFILLNLTILRKEEKLS